MFWESSKWAHSSCRRCGRSQIGKPTSRGLPVADSPFWGIYPGAERLLSSAVTDVLRSTLCLNFDRSRMQGLATFAICLRHKSHLIFHMNLVGWESSPATIPHSVPQASRSRTVSASRLLSTKGDVANDSTPDFVRHCRTADFNLHSVRGRRISTRWLNATFNPNRAQSTGVSADIPEFDRDAHDV